MEPDEFALGCKVFFSCGGPRIDDETLDVWWQALRNINRDDFMNAVLDIIKQSDESLGFINFVGEVTSRAATYRRRRVNQVIPAERQLKPGETYISKQELKAFIKGFTKSLGDVPLTKEEVEKEMNDFRNRRDMKTGG